MTERTPAELWHQIENERWMAAAKITDERINAERTITNERWDAHQKVHNVTEAEINRRLNEMNELRKQVSDERGLYLTKSIYDTKQDVIRAMIDDLRKTVWIGLGAVLGVSALLTLAATYWGHH